MSMRDAVNLPISAEQLKEYQEQNETNRKVLVDAAMRGDDLRWLDHPKNWSFAYDVNRLLAESPGGAMSDIVKLRTRMIYRWAIEQAQIEAVQSLAARLTNGSST